MSPFRMASQAFSSLADLLLHTNHPLSTLSPGEREIIAAYVSSLNDCAYCFLAHASVACAHPSHNQDLDSQPIYNVISDPETSAMSAKMKALLRIAGAATRSGREVTGEMVEEASKEGATEMDVHDTVLIAGMFYMFNRYVDGLGMEMPVDLEAFEGRGKVIAKKGYVAMMPPVKGDQEGK